MANKAVSFIVDNLGGGGCGGVKGSDVNTIKSQRGHIKAIQCRRRSTLMLFPGARRLVCRKRLTKTTAFLKKHGANEKEFCICLYATGSELPDKLEFMTKDKSVTCPDGSRMLAEYLLDDQPVRVQIMKYSVDLDCFAPPVNQTGRWKSKKSDTKGKAAVSFFVTPRSDGKGSHMSPAKSQRGQVKATQIRWRRTLMSFPGARRLVCRKRVTGTTAFLKKQGATEQEFCICLYVTDSELPDKWEFMTRDKSVTCPSGSRMLAEYLLDRSVRVQIMKYSADLDCFAPPVNQTGRWKNTKSNTKDKAAVSFFVTPLSDGKGSDMSTANSQRVQVKATQIRWRHTLMSFPGARSLVCRKRLTETTAFLKEEGATEKEFCICLYVTGSELPDKLEFMTRDKSVTCPSGSRMLAEYLLNDQPVRVQIMKYSANLDCFAPPVNQTGRWKSRSNTKTKAAVSFFVTPLGGGKGSYVGPEKSQRVQVKAIQCRRRHTLMSFPGARRLVCRKRLTETTAFLKKQCVTEKEFCICLYVTGSELPDKLQFMTRDKSVTCPSGSRMLAEYLLNDEPVRVQIMKYSSDLDCFAPPVNQTGRWKTNNNTKTKAAVSFLVTPHSSGKGSYVGPAKSQRGRPAKSQRGQVKAIQCRRRHTLMSFPGARRLVCRKRLTDATAFLKKQGANENEFCICLYVTGSKLPDKLEFMTKDHSVTCSSGSRMLAEYILDDQSTRVQIMKYSADLDCFAPPANHIGRWKIKA